MSGHAWLSYVMHLCWHQSPCDNGMRAHAQHVCNIKCGVPRVRTGSRWCELHGARLNTSLATCQAMPFPTSRHPSGVIKVEMVVMLSTRCNSVFVPRRLCISAFAGTTFPVPHAISAALSTCGAQCVGVIMRVLSVFLFVPLCLYDLGRLPVRLLP